MRVLVSDHFEADFLSALNALNVTVEYLPEWTFESLCESVALADILVIKSKTAVNNELLPVAQNLKLIVRGGAGLDHVDLAAASARGVRVAATPRGNCDAVGEQAVGMLLVLLNKMGAADRAMRQGRWIREPNRGYEIQGKTVGIIGYGNTGAAFAQKISGFGAKILAHDTYKTGFSDQFVNEAPLEQLFEECDIVSVHIPLNAENRHYINVAFINRFSKAIWLLNLARGGVMNTEAVVEGLERGKLLGAALDVFETEPIDKMPPAERALFDRLCLMENVVLTPHLGGVTYESANRINRLILETVKKFLGE